VVVLVAVQSPTPLVLDCKLIARTVTVLAVRTEGAEGLEPPPIVGCIAWLDFFGLAAESKVIPVRIDSHKISHAVWIIFGVKLGLDGVDHDCRSRE
jgi:hypothetical protein